MVDIETLGRRPGAVVLAIGAVRFEPGAPLEGPHFLVKIDIQDAERLGLKVDCGTLMWWLERLEMLREMASIEGLAVRNALASFEAWLPAGDDWEIWANSPSFDCRLLEAAFDAAGCELPWRYWQERDYRTLKAIAGGLEPAPERLATKMHSALDDAVHQAWHARAMLAAMAARAAGDE